MPPWVSKFLSGLREVCMLILGFLHLCWPVILMAFLAWVALRRYR